MKHKVLVDISLAHISSGFSGIPQDARLLFGNLMNSQRLELAGLIYSSGENIFYRKYKNDLATTSVFLGIHLNGYSKTSENGIAQKVFAKLSPRLHRYVMSFLYSLPYKFTLNSLDMDAFGDMIWRSFFSSTLDVALSKELFKKKMFWSGMSAVRILNGALGKLPICELDSRGFDFTLLQDVRAVKLSHETQKIIRYHDALPVFASDTFGNELHTLGHIHAIKKCAEDSIFVCNSTNSVNELSRISQKAADKAHVIPCLLPPMERKDVTRKVLEKICLIRRSSSTQPTNQETDIQKWLGQGEDIPPFIMSLATIEPRKNYIGLIEAWLRLRYETGRDIKLMIVGRPGWLFKKTLRVMRPLVKSGDLMHLEGVAQLELPYLYSAASCFVFPSFCEGFGLPPNEAMQCGCPVTVSDIPAHRYSVGDGALYFNPYDQKDMSHKMGLLMDKQKNQTLIDDFIEKGYSNVKRYSGEAVLPQWEGLFDRFKKDKVGLQ